MNNHLIAEISSTALHRNLRTIRRLLRPKTKLCAVVKADCYGHGWTSCGEIIAAEADWLAVATPDEALTIRKSGCSLPTLVFMSGGFLGKTNAEMLRQLIGERVTLTITTAADLAVIAEAASQTDCAAQVHVKIDSGMTRSGVLAADAPRIIRQARRTPNVRLTGVYTHFASADAADKTSARQQFARFMSAIENCGNDVDGILLHAANSAAIIDLPETHLDMVRLGIAMYGYQPSDEMQNRLPLQPILRLVGRLTQIREAPAGVAVGYGETHRLNRSSRLGLTAIGYADGYLRQFSNRVVMQVQERRVPVCGRISMDQTVVDLTDVQGASVGDEVEIISCEPSMPNSVESLARLANTIPYEITCGLGNRIRRVLTTPTAVPLSVHHTQYAHAHE
jgi:alanine racemase